MTAATGATDGGWYKAGVTVHLAAVDGNGESGVKELSYALDGAAPTTVAATADVNVPATAGAHMIMYHATDVAGNAEAEKMFTVNIDTAKPVTSASAASVVKGRSATLKYKVTETGAERWQGDGRHQDQEPRRQGRDDPQGRPGDRERHRVGEVHLQLARGVYTYTVYATDVAGNAQAKAGSARLTVK